MSVLKLIGIGAHFPNFELESISSTTDSNSGFVKITQDYLKGKWSVLFTWPFDFTFVCPTEIIGFNGLYDDFQKLNCNLLGCSIDSAFVHKEWLKSTLGDIKFPLLSDVRRELSTDLGILDSVSGATYRTTYIIDPDLVIRSISINDMQVGRNPNEVLRLVEAFQTDKLCGCDWQPGQATLN